MKKTLLSSIITKISNIPLNINLEIVSYNTHKRNYVYITQVYNETIRYIQNMKYSISVLLVGYKYSEIIVSIQVIDT